jgi:hypothetical protein
MVRKVDRKTGAIWHEPPYTAAEEADFYRRIAGGPIVMLYGPRPAPQRPSGDTHQQEGNGHD